MAAADTPDNTSKRGKHDVELVLVAAPSPAPVAVRYEGQEAVDLHSAKKMNELPVADTQPLQQGQEQAAANARGDLGMQSLLNYLRRLSISEEEIRKLVDEGVTTIAKFESLSAANLAVFGINIVERKAARDKREANQRERNRLPSLLLNTDMSDRGRALLIQHVPSMEHFLALDLDAMSTMGLDIMDRQVVLDLQARLQPGRPPEPKPEFRLSSVLWLCWSSASSNISGDETSAWDIGLVGCIAASAAAALLAVASR